MKRIITAVLALALAALLTVPAWATAEDNLPRVVDRLGWLGDRERESLEETILTRAAEDEVDVAIFLLDALPDGMTLPTDYADARYAEGGYGFGDSRRCVILTVDMGSGYLATSSYEGTGRLFSEDAESALTDLFLDGYFGDASVADTLRSYVEQVYAYAGDHTAAATYRGGALPDWYPADPASFADFHTAASTPRVVDDADLFTDEQEAAMAEKIAAIRDSYNMDFVVYTAPSAYGLEHNMLAADFYQFNGYGVGDDFSGGVLLICVDPVDRGWYTAACGRYEALYTPEVNERLNARLRPWLARGAEGQEDAYGRGVLQYLDDTAAVMAGKKVAKTYNFAIPGALAAIAFVLVGGITLAVERHKMKTVREAADAEEYLVPGSFHLRRHRDFYLHSTVSRHRRESDTKSGGGGGGGHFSSSGGRGFSGGGGKF